MSDSVRPHTQQPNRVPCPWDSPGKNTGMGCHFLLQCMKVKSESEVTQSCPTLHNPMDCSPSGSSVHGILQARVLEWVAIAFPMGMYISSYFIERNQRLSSHKLYKQVVKNSTSVPVSLILSIQPCFLHGTIFLGEYGIICSLSLITLGIVIPLVEKMFDNSGIRGLSQRPQTLNDIGRGNDSSTGKKVFIC